MRERRFRKGDVVAFQVGLRTVQGVVKEDRGPLGIGGRHLYGIEFVLDPYSDGPTYAEFPAVDLELVQPAKTRK